MNEWTKSVSVEFGLEASAVVHRVTLPQGYYDVNDDTTIRMDVIPSDLVRLMGDIMGRIDNPKVIRQCLDPDSSEDDCDPERLIEFNLTSEGLMNFEQMLVSNLPMKYRYSQRNSLNSKIHHLTKSILVILRLKPASLD